MIWELLAQVTNPAPDAGLGDIVATYGPFAPFAAFLLLALKVLWDKNKSQEDHIRTLTDTAMEKVLPLVLEATNVLSEAVEALKEVRERQGDGQRMIALMGDLLDAMDEMKLAIDRADRATRAANRKKAT